MKRSRRNTPRSKKHKPHQNILMRFIIVFCLVGVALLISRYVFTSMISGTSVLSDKIFLAHNGSEDTNAQPENTDAEETDHLREDTKVFCVGEEKRKYKTTYKECKKMDEELSKPLEFEVIETPALSEPTTSPETTIDTINIDLPINNSGKDKADETGNEEQSLSNLPTNERFEDESRTSPLPNTPIRVQIKDSGETINLNTKKIKIELQQENGHIVVKAQQEDGTTIELMDDALFHIEERLAIDRIKIATTSADEFLIQRNSTAAVTSFPLSWDLTTNSLIVTTPAGRKNVPILPDVAVQNLIASKELNQTTIPESLKKDRNVNLGTILDIATLTHRKGVPVYQITGITSQKFLGLFPVAIEKTVDVSGETGEITGTNETLINRFVDLLSV